MEDKLAGFTLSHRGTLQFTEDKPVPESVIKEIVLTGWLNYLALAGRVNPVLGATFMAEAE